MRELFRKYQLVVSLALGFAPVAVLIFLLLGPELLSWSWVYPVAFGVFSMLGAWVPAKARLLYGIAVSSALILLSFLPADSYTWQPILMADMCYAALFLWSLIIYSQPSTWELSDILRLICGGLHLAAQFVVYMDRAESRLLTAQAPGLHASFVVFLLLLPFSMNRDSVNGASAKSRPVPDGIRRKNTWLTVAMVALAGLISFIPHIFDWIKEAVLWIVRMFSKLLGSSPSEPQDTSVTTPVQSGGEGIPVVEESSFLTQVVETVLVTLGIAVTVGLCLLAVVLLLRKLKQWIGDVWARLEQYAAAVAEDYEDEITDIRGEFLGERIARKRNAVFWRKEQPPTHPGENIRFGYRQLLRKHPGWTANTTARENMPQNMAALYEKARYSGHPVTELEAEQFRTGAKDLR